jgi:predicted dehydrogenase
MDRDSTKSMSRRDFARTSAAAGFAVLASRRGWAQQANSETLKVGLLGCGSRGGGAAVNMLQGNDNVLLIAMADVFEDRLSAKRSEIADHGDERVRSKYAVDDGHCFVGLDAYEKILATDIDIIIDGTLPYCRPTHIAHAVEKGKHIFTEKPAASDPHGCKIVIDAANKAREKGLSFVAGTQRRHQKPYVETIKQIQDGAIGDLVAGRAYWNGTLPFAHDRKPEWSDLEHCIRNWYGFCWVAGDNIVEQHMHNLDVINWVLGATPVSVVASGGRAWKPDEPKYGDIFDHFTCDYEYPNGVHVMSMSRHWYNSVNDVSEAIVGTKGTSTCRDLWSGDHVDPYVQEHMNLVASIRGDGPYLNEGVQVAESTLTAIIGRMAAYTGQKVEFRQALEEGVKITPDELDFSKSYPTGPVPRPGAPKA